VKINIPSNIGIIISLGSNCEHRQPKFSIIAYSVEINIKQALSNLSLVFWHYKIQQNTQHLLVAFDNPLNDFQAIFYESQLMFTNHTYSLCDVTHGWMGLETYEFCCGFASLRQSSPRPDS